MYKLKTKLKKIYTLCVKELSKNNKIIKSKSELKNKLIDKKLIIGLVIGITAAAGTSIFAQEKQNSMFSSITNFFGINSTGNQPSINPVSSIINAQLSAEAQKCATGAEGTWFL